MQTFEIQGPDGQMYEVQAPDIETAARALSSVAPSGGGVSADPAAVQEFRDKSRALATGAADGASFGFGDNIAAGIGGVDSMVRGNGFRRGYDETLDIVREGMARDQQANPGLYAGGQIAGASIPALAAAPLASGTTTAGTIGRSTAIGTVEGALHGAGQADGEDVGEGAVKGGLLGAMFGAGGPLAVSAASRARRMATEPLSGMFGVNNTRKANRALTRTMDSAGMTAEDASRAVMEAVQDGQSDFRLMDALGRPGQRRANGIVRGSDGEAATELASFLESRQLGQPERVSQFVDDAFGMNGQTAAQTRDGLTAARSTAAEANYSAAREGAQEVDVRGAVAVIDDRIGGMEGSNIAGDSIDGKLQKYRNRLMANQAPEGELSRELSDFQRVLGVKQEIQDDIGTAVRAGRNNEARELGKVVAELDAALENASEGYRVANDSFAQASREIDAIDAGANMARPATRAADNVSTFEGMTPAQQQAARAGYGDRLLSQIEANPAPTANRARPMQSPKRQTEAAALANDPDLFQRRMMRENAMWETQNKALQGSQTANNLEDIAEGSAAAGGALQAGRSALNLQLGDTVAQIARVIGDAGSGQTEATRQMIARALMSDDPMKALAPAIKQDKNEQLRRRFIEGILRSTGHVALN